MSPSHRHHFSADACGRRSSDDWSLERSWNFDLMSLWRATIHWTCSEPFRRLARAKDLICLLATAILRERNRRRHKGPRGHLRHISRKLLPFARTNFYNAATRSSGKSRFLGDFGITMGHSRPSMYGRQQLGALRHVMPRSKDNPWSRKIGITEKKWCCTPAA